MRRVRILAVFASALVVLLTAAMGAQAPADRKLQLSFDGQGNVTLIAQGVTVREVLAEWARLGGRKAVNAERVNSMLPPLQFENAPELQVLQTVLRSVSGYIVGPRLEGMVGSSALGNVMILPTSTPTTTGSSTTTSTAVPVQDFRANDQTEVPPVGGQVLQPGPAQPPPAGTRPPAAPGNYTPTITVPQIQSISPVTKPADPTPPLPGRGGGADKR